MIRIPTMDDVRAAEAVMRRHLTPAPLIRSYRLEKLLQLPPSRQVWLKDYGWTPVGSFKLMGALNWMAAHAEEIGDRPVAAHSSGNFASGISFAGMTYGKRVVVVMPETAPRTKFELTRSFGAETLTYDAARDHITGDRERLAREFAEREQAVAASPYDDPHVIAGNGVGGQEIVDALQRQQRGLSHFFCQVSGGGLLAGHALAIADGFPEAAIIAAEPASADDFCQSLQTGERVRIDHPQSICDGLLSYEVGDTNWPILKRLISRAVPVPDGDTCRAMKWLYESHGLRVEPSGAIATAALFAQQDQLEGDGDIVVVISGRNVDEQPFRDWIAEV